MAVAALSPSCTSADPPAPAASGSAPPSTSAPLADSPPPLTSHPTTAGPIALGNLNGQIRTLESAHSKRDLTGQKRRLLIELLSLRAEMSGRLEDLERAADLAESLSDLPSAQAGSPSASATQAKPPSPPGRAPSSGSPPVSPTASAPGRAPSSGSLPVSPVTAGFEDLLTRASMRAALHRFDESSTDLLEAEKRGAPPARTRKIRISIFEARGQLEQALSLAVESRTSRPGIDTWGVEAVLLGELDRRPDALAAFRSALASFRDTSPFPVAWLFFRQAQLWEREARPDLAIAYHEAALARVPTYAHAAAHLARLLPPARAESLLLPLLETSDDPDLESVLAQKLKEKGDHDSAKPHIAKAAARYDTLVARHPEAFADHAAQFWLDLGGDPKKALDLARLNLKVRKTPDAYKLAILAALEAGDRPTACALGTESLSLPHLSGILREIAKSSCAPQ
ncbi:MAG: hypothetical protein R3B70_13725 [Polyangiaceae bacterium]